MGVGGEPLLIHLSALKAVLNRRYPQCFKDVIFYQQSTDVSEAMQQLNTINAVIPSMRGSRAVLIDRSITTDPAKLGVPMLNVIFVNRVHSFR